MNLKISRKKQYEYEIIGLQKQSQTRSVVNVYVGIFIFVAIFFPFVIINYRHQIGSFLSTIINGIGGFALVIGGLYILFGIIGVVTHGHNSVKHIIYGATLLWIGCWCTGTVLNIFGVEIGNFG